MNLFFVLGSQPLLSLAELFHVESFSSTSFGNHILIAQSNHTINIQKFQAILGGTVKIGRIYKNLTNIKNKKTLHKEIITAMTSLIDVSSKKIQFGISLYPLQASPTEKTSMTTKYLQELAQDIKEHFKKQELHCRFVLPSQGTALSSVQVAKNRLFSPTGHEFVLIQDGASLWIGKTDSTQDFELYSKRDYGRPSRQQKSGMLPPKLAQIMLNLARDASFRLAPNLLDPFCGAGTILQEAVLLGYQEIFGSDISQKAVDATTRNLHWLDGYPHLHPLENLVVGQHSKRKIFQCNVKDVHHYFSPKSIHAVVTEPYLGPPIKKPFGKEEAHAALEQLKKLYIEAFQSLKKILARKGRIVIIFPLFKGRDTTYELHIQSDLNALGFQSIDLSRHGIDLSKLIYSRPDQYVRRNITVWEETGKHQKYPP